MSGRNIGIITQARMGSTRLLGKMMLEIKGKSLLQYHIERLQKSSLPIYVATTDNPADTVIAECASKNGVHFYRGSEDDVLDRYYHCAKKNNLDVIIRVTSDCPLIDGGIIQKAVENYLAFKSNNVHYSCNVKHTLPHGMNFEVFSFLLLEEAHQKARSTFEREHVTPYIIQNISGNVVLKHYTKAKNDSNYRITVDTEEDFLLVKKLIEEYDADKKTMEEIISVFENHPELILINLQKTPHIWGTGKSA